MRAMLTGQHFAAVQAVLGRDGAGYEVLAMCEDAALRGVAIAEELDASRTHPRRVNREICVERFLVGEPVLDRPADPPGGR